MADNIEHQDKGELVANCDQLQNDEVVVTTSCRKSNNVYSWKADYDRQRLG